VFYIIQKKESGASGYMVTSILDIKNPKRNGDIFLPPEKSESLHILAIVAQRNWRLKYMFL
jgi:hypothetical protein